MTEQLGQLACGRCGERFWPEVGALRSVLVVRCTACGAGHANPAARLRAPAPSDDEALAGWLRAHWLHDPHADYADGTWITTSQPTTIVDLTFPTCIFHPLRRRGYATVLIAAAVPAGMPSSVGGQTLELGPAGVRWTAHNHSGVSRELVSRVIEALQSAGATRLYPLQEVAAPDPITDPRSAPGAFSCTLCGAPIEGARCVHCGVAANGAAADVSRVHAGPPEPVAPVDQPSPSGAGPALGCVRCGTIGRGSTCARCETPFQTGPGGAPAPLPTSYQYFREALAQRMAVRALVFVLVVGVGFYALPMVLQIAQGPLAMLTASSVVLILALPLLYFLHVPRAQLVRWRPRLAALAGQLGDGVVQGPSTLRAWSASVFKDDRGIHEWLQPTASQGTILFSAGGFPMVITVRIEPLRGVDLVTITWERPHVVILLAAELPRDAAYWMATAYGARMIAELERAGFSVMVREGGLAAIASARAIEDLQRDPDRIAILAPLAYALARLAHGLGAQPPVTRT